MINAPYLVSLKFELGFALHIVNKHLMFTASDSKAEKLSSVDNILKLKALFEAQ